MRNEIEIEKMKLTEWLEYILTTLSIYENHLKLNDNSNQSEVPHCIFRPLSAYNSWELISVWVQQITLKKKKEKKRYLAFQSRSSLQDPYLPACPLSCVQAYGYGGMIALANTVYTMYCM